MDPITTTAAGALVAKPAIEAIIKELVIPKIKAFCKVAKLKYDDVMIPRGEHFQEYFHRTYKQYSVANMIALRNTQNDLKSIYIPLTIERETSNSTKYLEIFIDKFPTNEFNQIGKVLITDTAGMGKSTLSKRLFLDVIDNGIGIPIFIELRRLSSTKTIIQLILEQISSLTKDFDTSLMLQFISSGGFIFFFDGFDEIPFKERELVISNIQDFINKASRNTYIMTSRPELSLVAFSDFMEMKIRPLRPKEAYELLRKYDKQGDTSSLLIEKIKQAEYQMLDEFLKNPLLVSLLFIAFDYKHTIPLKKHIFYRQVFDAYFEHHDLSKGGGYIHEKKSKLNMDDFSKVLKNIAFQCMKTNTVEYSKDELLDMIEKSKKDCFGLNFTNSDFFDDLLMVVPLFCSEGNYYKWVHKSLQEYFAAMYIAEVNIHKSQILERIYRSKNLSKFINLLDIFYDIDTESFRSSVLKLLLDDYLTYFQEFKKLKPHNISQNQFDIRAGLLFGKMIYYGVNDDIFNFHDVVKSEKLFSKLQKIKSNSGTKLPKARIVSLNRAGSTICYGLALEKDFEGLLKLLQQKGYDNIIHYNFYNPDSKNFFESVCVTLELEESNLLNNQNIKLIHNKIKFYHNFNDLFNELYIDAKGASSELLRINNEIHQRIKCDDILDGI